MSELLAEGTGKTKMNYIFDLACETIGIKRDLLTPAMKHGIENEFYALKIAEKHGFKSNTDKEGNQQFYLHSSGFFGATPDAIREDAVLDTKCQYYIHTYIEQRRKLPAKYFIQVQTQMMCLNVNQGYLLNYLTKPEEWGSDTWEEFPIPLDDRYHIHEIKVDAELQDRIQSTCEKYFPYIQICAEILKSAEVLDDTEFFYQQFYSEKRFKKLKDINWIENIGKIIRHANEFYCL